MRATILIDGVGVTLLPKRAPVGNSEPIRGRTLTVIPLEPADPALFSHLPPESRHARFTATVEPKCQQALAIMDVTEAEAIALGQTLGLDVVLFWDGRRADRLRCAAR